MLLKYIIILAGPNGAGKTTAAPVLLPQELGIREFVNADEIARGLSPFNAEGAALAAGRFMIERMRYLVRNEQSFAFETTCSGRVHASWLGECRAKNDVAVSLATLAPGRARPGCAEGSPRRARCSPRRGGPPLLGGPDQPASPLSSARRCGSNLREFR